MSIETIVQSCQYLLHSCPDAEEVFEYIKDRVSSESQKKFLFGYFPPSSKLNLLTGLIGEDLLKEHRLLFSRNNLDSCKFLNYFEDHPMVLPYKDVYGNIIALIGRSILSEAERKERKISKYKNTVFNKGNHLFGLYEAKQEIISSGFAYVVEGQFDAIKANEKGIKNIVALGNSNMTPYQAALLSRYTDTVFLVLDNDEAGEKGRKRIEDKFGKYLHINNLYLPEGYKDIDEYFSDNDAESLNFLC
jgi:DNA primase